MTEAKYFSPVHIETYEFELFFDLSPDLLCIAGFDGYFKRINPAVSLLLGYTNEELLSRPIDDFVFSEDRHSTSHARGNLTKGTPLFHFENRYVTKCGEIVWLYWTSMSVESDKLVFAIAKNITHKKKLEEERNMLIGSLSKINKDLKQLTYTTSHDLRSPVNNLLSIFSLLDESKINDPETVEFITVLKLASEGLKETIDKYVDILSEKDKPDVELEQVNLPECMNAVLRSIHSLVQNSKATINANFSDYDVIGFNKSYMESIFLNLLTNAIKYARPDVLPVITIQTKKINGTHQLIISDNGLGFDIEKVKDKIFGLHQKFHHHADSKGIGLYLVNNHITSLGGRIAVESRVNAGATFTITFQE